MRSLCSWPDGTFVWFRWRVGAHSSVHVMLVGNKSDGPRAVTTLEGQVPHVLHTTSFLSRVPTLDLCFL